MNTIKSNSLPYNFKIIDYTTFECISCEQIVSKLYTARRNDGKIMGVLCMECLCDWNYFQNYLLWVKK